ncbi:hypothetical protein E4T56_gene564 [Termitomyces sp. T112]|nr:hypothetical protein E4T56_gene564 [Termitomyces sp. T112]
MILFFQAHSLPSLAPVGPRNSLPGFSIPSFLDPSQPSEEPKPILDVFQLSSFEDILARKQRLTARRKELQMRHSASRARTGQVIVSAWEEAEVVAMEVEERQIEKTVVKKEEEIEEIKRYRLYQPSQHVLFTQALSR